MYNLILRLLKNWAILGTAFKLMKLRGIKALRGEGFFVKSLKSNGHRPQIKIGAWSCEVGSKELRSMRTAPNA